MPKHQAPALPHHDKGRLLLLLFFLLLLYVVLPRLHSFSSSFGTLTDAKPFYVGLAVLLVAVTYLAASAMYTLLALRRVSFRRTLAVQTATAFANRLLPAGIGGLALYVRYLRKAGHTLPQALAVAGTNNTVGMAGHLLLLAAVAVAGHREILHGLHSGSLKNVSVYAGVAVVGAALVVGILAFGRLRRYLFGLVMQVFGQVASYRNHPLRLGGALLCSLALTAASVAALWASAAAVGLHVSAWNVFVVFTVGLVVGTATPTPGGLGGAEAGWVAGLIAYGAAAPAALAAVLLYRLLSYWLPLLPGFALFVMVRKRYL